MCRRRWTCLVKCPRRVLQRDDFLRENLRLVVADVDLADDQDGFVRHEQLAVFVVVLVQAEHLHRAFQVLQRHHRVGLAALLGDALLHRGDQPADARQAAGLQLRQRGRVGQRILLQNRRVTA